MKIRLTASMAAFTLVCLFPALGQSPVDILLSDLNGDGTLDTLTANSDADSVTLRTNDGTGTFSLGTDTALTVGDKPVSIAAGNLVVGGGTDIAVACQDADVVRILSNSPVGTLTVFSSIDLSAIGATPSSIAVGDLNGAGTDDFAVALEGELLIAGKSGIAVSLDGGTAMMLAAPPSGFGVIKGCDIGDLDGDGDNDVICTMSASAFVLAVKYVLIYENDGAGGFAAPVILTTGEKPQQVSSFDIDGDYDDDLIVTSHDLLSSDAVQIFMNDGLTAGSWSAGSFSDGGSYVGGRGPIGVACGDIGDNNIPDYYHRNDVVVTNLIDGNVTHFSGFINAGAGFESTNTFAAGTVPMAVAIGELNGDYTADMVIVNSVSADVTVVLTDPLAQVKTFGSGCPGTGALAPSVGTVGLPVAGSSTFAVTLTDGRANAPSLLALSLSQITTPLGGGCTLYLGPFSLMGPFVTDGLGGITLLIPIPGPASAFFGREAFFQWYVTDPAGAFQNQATFSDALRVKVAN